MKRKPIIWVSVSIIIVVLFIALLYSPSEKAVTTIYTKDGFIDVEIGSQSLFEKLFTKQTLYFSKLNAYVGEKITIDDRGLIGKVEQNFPTIWEPQNGDKAVVMIIKDGNNYQPITASLPNTITSTTKISVSYYPDAPGKYTAELYRARGDTNEFMDASFGTVTVTTEPTSCPNSDHWGSWQLSENIANGERLLRYFYQVQGDCTELHTNKEYKTVCDDGYTINGDGKTQTATGWTSSCKESTPVVTECTDDILAECPDGGIIVTKKCVSGVLQDTNEECSAITTIDVYRLEDNTCYPVTINSADKQSNDYNSLLECQTNIQIEDNQTITVQVFRFENNACVQKTINIANKQDNDYATLSACNQNIANAITVYRLESNTCKEISISATDKKANDYTSKDACLAQIGTDLGFNPYMVGGIAIAVVLALLVFGRLLRR